MQLFKAPPAILCMQSATAPPPPQPWGSCNWHTSASSGSDAWSVYLSSPGLSLLFQTSSSQALIPGLTSQLFRSTHPQMLFWLSDLNFLLSFSFLTLQVLSVGRSSSLPQGPWGALTSQAGPGALSWLPHPRPKLICSFQNAQLLHWQILKIQCLRCVDVNFHSFFISTDTTQTQRTQEFFFLWELDVLSDHCVMSSFAI